MLERGVYIMAMEKMMEEQELKESAAAKTVELMIPMIKKGLASYNKGKDMKNKKPLDGKVA